MSSDKATFLDGARRAAESITRQDASGAWASVPQTKVLLGSAGEDYTDLCPSYNKLFQSDGSTKGFFVRAGRTLVKGWFICNEHSATVYVKLYDKSGAAASSDTPRMVIPIPAGAGANLEIVCGLRGFDSGLAVRVVTGFADNDDTAAPNVKVTVNVMYSY